MNFYRRHYKWILMKYHIRFCPISKYVSEDSVKSPTTLLNCQLALFLTIMFYWFPHNLTAHKLYVDAEELFVRK